MNQQPALPLVPDTDWRPSAPPDLSAHDEVELDGEFNGLRWMEGDRPVGWAIGTAAGTQYLPFAHADGHNLDEATVKRWVQRELRHKRIRNHSTKIDAHMMRVWGVDLRAQGCTFHDVQHSAALLDDHRKTFTLDELGQAELGEGKIELPCRKDQIAEMPAGVIAPYAERDVALVRRLAEHYAPRLAAEDLGRVSRLEDAVIPVVIEMEANGMPLDLETLTAWEDSSRALLEKLHWELYRQVGFTVNPDSSKDMTRLWAHCGETVQETAKGAPSFTAPIVTDAATRHDAIRLVWRIGKLVDLRNKYLVKYLKDQVGGALYSNLNQLKTGEGGTVSGRFSSASPNLQQVMGADKHGRAYGWLSKYGDEDYLVKRLFRPASGVWVSADAKQCEYRIFSHYSGSERLLSLYAQDPLTNFHDWVRRIVEPAKPDITKTEVKVFNFLAIFGGGMSAAQRILQTDPSQTQSVYDAYHRQFPEASRTLYRAMKAADARGFVRTLLGRRCRFPGSPGRRDRIHKALNAVVQGTGADAMKQTMVDVYAAREALGLTLRMTVHDSLEADLVDAGAAVRYREFLDEQRLPLKVPLLWDVGTGPTWAEAG